MKKKDQFKPFIACMNCGFMVQALPEEIESFKKSPWYCFVCGAPLHAYSGADFMEFEKQMAYCEEHHDLVRVSKKGNMFVFECSVCHKRYTVDADNGYMEIDQVMIPGEVR